MGLPLPGLELTGPMMTGEDIFHLEQPDYTLSQLRELRVLLDDTTPVEGTEVPAA